MSKTKLEKADLEEISKAAGKAFIHQSDSYKQKLVYNLLNTIKVEKKDEFISLLLRAMNARKGDVSGFAKEIQKIQNNMKTKQFTDIAHAIVIGIMSTYGVDEKSVEKEEQEE